MRRALTAIVLVAWPALAQTTDADQAAANLDFVRARELYRVAVDRDPDPKQRDLAAIRLANIEWRLDHDASAAEGDLARISDATEQASAAWIERARIAAELRGDFPAAAVAAQHAFVVAKQELDRGRAAYTHANSIIEPIRRARLAGRCQDDAANLLQAESELKAVVAKAGPVPAPARLLLDAALLSNDGQTALAAWRGYYGTTAQSSLLAPAASTLAEALPNWSGDVPAAVRRSAGLALADSRLFAEAALVLRDPCASHAVEANDQRVADIVTYDAAARSLAKQVDEYYRNLALRHAKPDDLRKIIDDAGHALWSQLEWSGKPKTYSESVLVDYLSRAFGAYIAVGNTGNAFDLHLAHRVLDEAREVTQYGRSASLQFIQLDGIISNGFSSWVRDGRSGDGGWANTAIYQVRPLYAASPYRLWLTFMDPQARAQHDREIEDETRRDGQRIANDPSLIPRGVAMRLSRQYLEQVLRDLDARKLDANAMREAFVARITQDQFESSIWAHEGRHAIDKKYHLVKSGDSAELEFRAKLSEVAFAPAPRQALDSISYDGPPSTPHGAANRRIGSLLTAWMRAHATEIAGLDLERAMLLQVDKLTDDQLREAFRSMDPLSH